MHTHRFPTLTQLGKPLGGSLSNRLAVYALNDLNINCPKSILALENWLDHTAFWLACLSTCTKTKDQLPFMINLLAINLGSTLGCSIQEARVMLKDEMVIQQLERVIP